MNEGGLVPYELTVQILINALVANPAKVSSYNWWWVLKTPSRLSPLNLFYFLYYELNGCNGELSESLIKFLFGFTKKHAFRTI